MQFLLAGLTIIIEFILVGMMVPRSLMDWSSTVESSWIAGFYGQETGRMIQNTALDWFRRLFLSSGWVEFSYLLVLPTEEDWKNAGPFIHLENTLGLIAFFKGRLDVFWMEIQQDILRFCQLGLWLLVLSPLWLIHILDGLSLRELKKQTFGYQSPFFHRYALYLTGWLWVALTFFILLPTPLPPPAYPAVVLIQGVLIGILSRNIQKRL